MKIKNKIVALVLSATLAFGSGGVALAKTFGNSLNGASTVEVMQVRYDGAAWNYKGSGYKGAWFKYTRNGKTLMYKSVRRGKVTGSVWDNLIDWSREQTTKFRWGRIK